MNSSSAAFFCARILSYKNKVVPLQAESIISRYCENNIGSLRRRPSSAARYLLIGITSLIFIPRMWGRPLYLITCSTAALEIRTFGAVSAKDARIYLAFPKRETLSHKLTWSHYFELLKCDDPLELLFYYKEAIKEGWKVRELKRQFSQLMWTSA